MASLHKIQPTSPNLIRVHEGGIDTEGGCKDGFLYVKHASDTTIITNVETDTNPINDETSQEQTLSDENFRWSHPATLLLLEKYREYSHLFQSTTLKKMDVWKKISTSLISHGYNVTHDSCEKKFSNLKIRYKKVVDNNNSTGRGRWRFQFYDEMKELLAGDPSVIPPILINSLSGTKVNSDNQAKNVTPESQSPDANTDAQTDTPTSSISPVVENSPITRRKRKCVESREPPEWFIEFAKKSLDIQQALLEEEQKKNDILKKILDKL